jgi:hypothetical protein
LVEGIAVGNINGCTAAMERWKGCDFLSLPLRAKQQAQSRLDQLGHGAALSRRLAPEISHDFIVNVKGSLHMVICIMRTGIWLEAKPGHCSYKCSRGDKRAGKQVALRDEQRSSISFPGAPQKSTITFECVPDPSSTGQAAVATPVQATNAKRMAAIKKCIDGPKLDFDRYVACMSK